MTTSRKNIFFNIYFGLIAGISFIWLCIATIVFAYDLISNQIISNEEYISQNDRNLERCNNTEKPTIIAEKEGLQTWPIIIENKQECIKKETERLLLKRSIDTKETLLLSGLRMVILLIVFPVHFISFRKINK